ncbi:MAG: addiction module protein [Gemmataceae bacterium]
MNVGGRSEAADVREAWRNELARRIADMRTGRVEAIDAEEFAKNLLLKAIRKYGNVQKTGPEQ